MLFKLFRPISLRLIFIQRKMSSDNPSSEYSACITTVSKDDIARKLARSIVEARLGACVNIIPHVRSIYEWQSKIEEDEELILLIKTRKENVSQLIEFIKKNHPYDVPELIELPIQRGNEDYLNWIDSIVKQKSSN